jgi:hypothetical protein
MRTSAPSQNARLLHQTHALSDLCVDPDALLHEFIHLAGTDVDELERLP